MPKKSLAFGILLILVIASAAVLAYKNDSTFKNDTQATPTQTASASPSPSGAPVILDTLTAESVVSSPLVVKGKAVGTWFFEASLPVKLLDANGKVVAQAAGEAQGEWMTTSYVPFSATLSFGQVQTPTGTLVVEKDNPSGLPERDESFRIPVKFSNVSTSTVAVKLFYPNSEKARELGDACSADTILPVERVIPITKTPVKDTINLLIKGELKPEEIEEGFKTEFPNQGFKLTSASMKSTTLTLEFADPKNFTSGGSCRVLLLAEQIKKTAMQFPDVKKVVLKPEELFQP